MGSCTSNWTESMVVDVRNLALRRVENDKSVASDFKSEIIDFKEMNTAFIQAIVTGNDETDGIFSLEVSLLCDLTSFVPYPGSERDMSMCTNFGWEFCCLAARYVRVCYTNGTLTTGTVDIWAQAKRT